MNRYADNLNNQSPSSRFFVFGRPLLLGGFSSLGGTTGYEDLELMRMVAVDGRERGWDYAGATIVVGEESGVVGRRMEEAQHESIESWTYDSWKVVAWLNLVNF